MFLIKCEKKTNLKAVSLVQVIISTKIQILCQHFGSFSMPSAQKLGGRESKNRSISFWMFCSELKTAPARCKCEKQQKLEEAMLGLYGRCGKISDSKHSPVGNYRHTWCCIILMTASIAKSISLYILLPMVSTFLDALYGQYHANHSKYIALSFFLIKLCFAVLLMG